jgi:pimeloyl-ACP methyl ester carboxylesterase
MAKELPWGVRAVAVDLPGFGKSDLRGLAPSVDLAADAVYQALIAHGVGNAVVVGWSLGGYVALALAERHPGFVVGLGLVASKASPDTPHGAENRRRIARDIEIEQSLEPISAWIGQVTGPTTLAQRRNLLPTVDSWIKSQHTTGVAWAQRAMARRPDRTHVVKEFQGPFAMITGREDKLVDLAEAEQLVRLARNGALTVIPGTDHLTPLEEPGITARAISNLHAQVVPHVRPAARSRRR